MKILVLSEPRSGSTNLAKWFKHQEDFTTFIEPYNLVSIDYKNNKDPFTWKFNTENLVIKEIYRPLDETWFKLLNSLVEFSDKTIILYRENKKEQLESWLAAIKSGNWGNKWFESDIKINPSQVNYFNDLVKGFKLNFIDGNSFFKITYEELYQSNEGIDKLINFINIDNLNKNNFPYGERYRTSKSINRLI
jgi:hypothetical protein